MDFVTLTSLLFARFGTSRVGLDGALSQTMAQLRLPDNFRLIHIPPRQKVRQLGKTALVRKEARLPGIAQHRVGCLRHLVHHRPCFPLRVREKLLQVARVGCGHHPAMCCMFLRWPPCRRP